MGQAHLLVIFLPFWTALGCEKFLGEQSKQDLFVKTLVHNCSHQQSHGKTVSYTCKHVELAKLKLGGTDGTQGNYGAHNHYLSVFLTESKFKDPVGLAVSAYDMCYSRERFCGELMVSSGIGCATAALGDGWTHLLCMVHPKQHSLREEPANLCRLSM